MVHHLHSQTMNHYFPLHSFKPTNIDRTFLTNRLPLFRRPTVHPTDDRRTVGFKIYRQPYMTGIFQALRIPTVGHEHETVLRAFHLKNIRALCMERLFGIFPDKRRRKLLPWPPQRSGLEHAGFIRCPTRTATRNHPIHAVTLKNGRSLVLPARRDTYIPSGIV